MTTAKNKAAERAAQVLARNAPEKKRTPSASPPLAKNVRMSAEVSPTLYTKLTKFCLNTAQYLGIARVTHVDVMRALIAELADDEDLQKAVCDRLAEDKKS